MSYWGTVDYLEMPPASGEESEGLILVQGAVLTFFAFIGFEDTFNVAEECRDPKRTIPLGLILAMSMAAILYIAVAVTAVSVVPWHELAEAPGPITEVGTRAAPFLPPAVFTVITLFAVGNTALVNYITASRLIYGMAHQGLLPVRLGEVHAARRTPHWAIAMLLVLLVPLSLIGTVGQLAAATVLMLLTVFSVVNARALRAQAAARRSSGAADSEESRCIVPALGALVCLALVVVRVGDGRLAARRPSPGRCCSAPCRHLRSRPAEGGARRRPRRDTLRSLTLGTLELPRMDEGTIDREAMGRLAKALVFICGADHPTTVAHRRPQPRAARPATSRPPAPPSSN